MSTAGRARPVRVMLVEDNAAVRRAVGGLLSTAGLEVCGEAATVAEARPAAAATTPDVAIIDLRLPDGSGVDAGRQVRAAHAGARVLLLTSASEDEAMVATMLAGASAFLVKQLLGNDLVGTVRAVAEGRTRVDADLAAAALLRLQGRTSCVEGEARLVRLLGSGCSDHEISQLLDIEEAAVRSQVASLTAVLGAGRSRRSVPARPGLGTTRSSLVPPPVPRVPAR